MPSERTPRSSVESLKREAKRWLRALHAHDPEARARLDRALADAPPAPTLRDVQHALAREHGFAGWTALVQPAEQARAARGEPDGAALAAYETMTDVLLEAYRTGTPEAMARLHRFAGHRRSWEATRTYLQLDLGKRPASPDDAVEITRDDAHHIIAKGHGFADWTSLRTHVLTTPRTQRLAAKPMRLFRAEAVDGEPPLTTTRDWDEVVRRLADRPRLRLDAGGQMTDALLADVAAIDGLASLDLSGSTALTDDGLAHLARLTDLRHLKLDGTAITDRGLAALGTLPALETLSLAMTHVTDAGLAALAACDALRDVNLSWTRTGDGALRALAGKAALTHLSTGNGVTDDGLALLHEIPAFATWRGGEAAMALLSYRAAPNQLVLRGSFGDPGMRHLRDLEGLFALDLDDRALGITAAGLEPLVALPNLGWLAVDAKDDWMPRIAEMPRLRFLGAQDTTAGDDGFVALSRSRSIEYVWGRRCHALRTRGFTALADMPALRGLSVSCRNVDDVGIAALPTFPALRELMPIDVPDAGYRHIGRCEHLQSLVLMYCRETTDAATRHITGLRELTSYFNSYTTITDRTPALLSTMESLERITFDACHGLTDVGIAALTRLPRLHELRVSGRGLTSGVASPFRAGVRVQHDV